MAAVMGNGSFTINEWRVDPSLNRISRGENVVKVDPQNMKVLELLASKPGEVFSQAEIEQSAWPDVVVTPNSVYQSIANLRRAFGDDRHNPQYIETIARKGYRCIGKVDAHGARSDDNRAIGAPSPIGSHAGRTNRYLTIGGALGLVVSLSITLTLMVDRRADSNIAETPHTSAKRSGVPSSRVLRAQLALELGKSAKSEGDLEAALRHYQVALDEAEVVYARTDNFFADVFTERAAVLLSIDKTDQALEEAERAVSILEHTGPTFNPLFPWARSVYAEALATYARHDEATAQAHKALDIASQTFGEDALQTTHIRATLARVQLLSQNWTEAELTLRKVIASVSATVQDDALESLALYRTLLAGTMYHQGRFEDAAQEVRAALQTLDTSIEYGLIASAYQVLGDALVRDGDIIGAENAMRRCDQYLRRAAAVPWRLARAESTEAEILIRQGKLDEARMKLQRAAPVLTAQNDEAVRLAYADLERRLAMLNAAQKQSRREGRDRQRG